ncbi:MAG: undecaprenyl-phosphate glucose phosphotransferase [Geminicoccaceae bacterium]
MHKRRDDWLSTNVVVGLTRLADIIVIVTTGFLAYYTRFDHLDAEPIIIVSHLFAGLLAAHVFQLMDLYKFRELINLFTQTRSLVIAWSLVMLGLVGLGFVGKITFELSRLWMGLWFVYGFLGLFSVRLVVKLLIRHWQRQGRLTRNLVVVGAGEHGQRLVAHMNRVGDHSGTRLIGLFDDRKSRVPSYVEGYPVLGTLDDLLKFARNHPIDQVVIALPWDAESRLLAWIKKLRSLPVDVRLCPDMIGFHLPQRSISHVSGLPMLNVFDKPLSGWNLLVKNIEDRLLAGLILILIAPLMAALALAVRLDSRGPILFKQKRYGFNNEVIEVYKFRSMYTHTAQNGPVVNQATKDDPRITRVGRFIRRTSLDELPQFINVLQGRMSIVGPRPHAVAHNEQYGQLIDEYFARHRVKPGITGWAQVNGYRGETETLDKMEKRVQYDLYYIENWSLLFDLRIIFKTLLVGFVDRRAY